LPTRTDRRPTNSLVMEVARLTSMKNMTTRVPLITAMVIAAMKLYSLKSSFEMATVVIVSAQERAEHRGVDFYETT